MTVRKNTNKKKPVWDQSHMDACNMYLCPGQPEAPAILQYDPELGWTRALYCAKHRDELLQKGWEMV